MTRPSLAGIEQRAAAATGGPWSAADEHGDLPGADPAWCVSRMTEDGRWMHDVADEFGLEPADAEFIAAARTAVPALTAAVRDVLAVLAPHWDAQVRREAKFGRSGSACVCEACNAVRAIIAHLDLTDPEGDPT